MTSRAMSLKGKIRNYAKANRITAQVVLQNYMFERFLNRLALSTYRDKFVIKGGILIASIVGLDTRSTMDLDTTLRRIPLTESSILEAINKIITVELSDGVKFKVVSSSLIRNDDEYGGFNIRIDAIYDTIITPLSIDVSTGDVITPDAIQYEFAGMFDEELVIRLWGYNVETVLAEKLETILRRGEFTTRPRDYYDVYILWNTQNVQKQIVKEALQATAEHRGTWNLIKDASGIMQQISSSKDLQNQWHKYQTKFAYAQDVEYQAIIKVLEEILL